MSDELLRAQINELIRDEIQEGINDYIDDKEKTITPKGFGGFVSKEEEGKELKVNIPHAEVEKLIKKYKKIKKGRKSNLYQAKLLNQHGKPL
jgi:hypothetical protein